MMKFKARPQWWNDEMMKWWNDEMMKFSGQRVADDEMMKWWNFHDEIKRVADDEMMKWWNLRVANKW